MNADKYIQELEATGDYRVLRRFVPPELYQVGEIADKGIGIVIDTETTSLDTSSASIIELGMVIFEYCKKKRGIYSIVDVISQFEDPGEPIEEKITAITGITDAMVAGQHFEDNVINDWLQNADLVIAHNAGFDRKMMERRFPLAADINWACSIRDVPWADHGFHTQSLTILAMHAGIFYDAHRALTDAQVTLHLLALPFPGEITSIPFAPLLENSVKTQYKIWATNTPFEAKDLLKAKGYRWHPGDSQMEKSWTVLVDENQGKAELEWLNSNVYHKDNRPPITKVTSRERYSIRG